MTCETQIYDLINVPLVTGTAFVKWHLPNSTTAEHRGRTDRAFIREHKVVWKYKRIITLRLVINKNNNNLQDCMINFEVVQDCSTPDRVDKITLGKIEINLAEYVDEVEFGPEGNDSIVRRYLMQDSKINSTLKIGISMRQIDGERNYFAPPLKTAIMFGGITGIVAGSQETKDDNGKVPKTIRSQNQSEIQDVYRQMLAASLNVNNEGHRADECIDDIFNGGDGWSSNSSSILNEKRHSDDDIRQNFSHHKRNLSSVSTHQHKVLTQRSISYNLTRKCDVSHIMPNASPGIQSRHVNRDSGVLNIGLHSSNEVDENLVKEDLIAWKIQLSRET